MQNKLARTQKRIAKIKQELVKIGEMRPGSLSVQYQKPEEKKGSSYQISYTHHMKSKTQHVRMEFVRQIEKEIKSYKKFKALTIEWVDLAIEHSILKIEIAKKSQKE